MAVIDYIILGIILIAIIVGLKKGLIASVLACIGLISTFILFARFGPMIRAGLRIQYNIGEFFSFIFAYIIIIILVAILVKILTLIFNYIASMLDLTVMNRLAGGLFFFLNSVVFIMILLLIINLIPILDGVKQYLIDNSVIIDETYKITDELMINYQDRLPIGIFPSELPDFEL